MNYQPITKENAAEILSVSKRTIDNMLADGTLPRPAYIGRRLYWHPDVFFGWLDGRLGKPVNPDHGSPVGKPGRPRKSGR
jgi:excisionase family DNA binding protein